MSLQKPIKNIPYFADQANKDILLSSIYHLKDKNRFYLLGFVIMPDHIHLIILPNKNESISKIMQSIKGFVSWRINKENGTKKRIWQKSFYDYVLDSEKKLITKLTYIHRNPLKEGFVEKEDHYKYSSAYPDNPTDLELYFNGGIEPAMLESIAYPEGEQNEKGRSK